jgi:hypothetical protein
LTTWNVIAKNLQRWDHFSAFFLKKYLVPKTLAKQVAVSEPAAEGQIATDFEVGLSWNGEEL